MLSGLGLGFLVGSLLLLAAVLYYTRIRNPVPHGRPDAEAGETGSAASATAGADDAEPTELCGVCEEAAATRTEKDMRLCAACHDDLFG